MDIQIPEFKKLRKIRNDKGQRRRGQRINDEKIPPHVTISKGPLRRRGKSVKINEYFTARQQEVLELMFLGKTNPEIAAILGIVDLTVKNHTQRVIQVLNAYNRQSACYIALKKGVLKPPELENKPEEHNALPELPMEFKEDEPESPMPNMKGLQIFKESKTVTFNGIKIKLGKTDTNLLIYFASHVGRIHTRQHLLDVITDPTKAIEERTIDVHIRRIRVTLPPNCGYDIETVRGIGYRFIKTPGEHTHESE